MKKIFLILSIVFGVILLFCIITYADIKLKERNDAVRSYNLCVERYNKELQDSYEGITYLNDDAAADCRNRGGCFEDCGFGAGACSELGYLPTTNIIFGTYGVMCDIVCGPICIEKP
jgi:hypothetical protein